MAIIYSYPLNTPKRDDLLIGTITYDEDAVNPVHGNPTVSFTVGSLLDLIASQGAAQNLQQVTNIGNTTTNSIVISNSLKVAGEYYDSSNQPGTAGQLLSSTATGTQWVNVAAQGVTSVGLSMPAAFTVANSPITQSGTLTVTGAGTAAQYINGLGNLVTFPTIPTQYVLPVATTVALGGIKIGYTQNAKNYPIILSNEQAYVNVPWTDTPYTLPVATSTDLGGVKIGYTQTLKKYPVELLNEQMFVDVPWTDTPYTLPVATSTDLGGVKIGYTTDATARNYAVSLDNEQMLVNVPWTDTQNPFQTITGTGTDNTDSGILLSDSGGTVLILGAGSVAASQTGNTITLTGTDTGVTGVTLAIADSTGTPLSESITNRELTLTSAKYVGGANVGYVPEGGTGTTYLKGDGTWAAIPTGLQFKGTWDASGGGGGTPDLTDASNKGAGFLWICDVAGTAYPNGGTNPPSTWNLGDWAVYDGTAWTRVPATNSGVTSITTTDGTFIDLTPNNATTGAVTVTADLSAADGNNTGTSQRFLTKNNTWAVPAYTTDTNTQNIYTNSWQQSTNDIILRKVLSGAGSGTQDIKIVKGANITFTYTDANNFTIAATDTQENTTWYIRDYADTDKTVNNLKYLKFVTATGTLGTALTGAGTTSDPYLMTLTSPDTNTQNTYTAGAGLSLSSFEFSADIDTTAASSATNNLSTDSGRYYAVQLDNNSTAADRKMVVNVPWSSGETYSWTVKDNAANQGSSSVTSGDSIKFVTATGPLGTVLTDPNSDGNFIMTLTSPDTMGSGFTVSSDTNTAVTTITQGDTLTLAGGTNVATVSDPDGTITINATDTNTTYDLTSGTDTTLNLFSSPVVATAQSASSAGSNTTILYDNESPAGGIVNGQYATGAGIPVGTRVVSHTALGITFNQTVNVLNNTIISFRDVDTVAFIAGSNVTLTGTSNEIEIAASNTTYDLLAVQTGGTNVNPALRLDPNSGNNDDVTLTGSGGTTITRTSDTAITIDSDNDNNTYSLGSGNTKVITLTDTSTSTAAGTVTFADGNDISISGNNGTITIASTFAEADTLATVTGRGATTTTKSYFNGDLEVNDTITVKRTGSNNGKISIEGNPPLLELKNYDGQTTSDQLLSSIEFYGSDTSGSNVAGVRASINCNTGFDDPTGTSNRNQGCLEFATYNGTDVSNSPLQRLKITPDGGFSFGGTSTAYGTSGQVLTSAGDAPPTWETFNGVTGSGTTDTVPRWSSSSGLGNGPLIFSQNSTATWESADTTMGGRLTVGNEGTNSVGSRIAILAPTGNASYLIFGSTTSSVPANSRNYTMGIDQTDRSFKFNVDSLTPASGNNVIKINYTGEIDFNTIPPVNLGNQTTSLRIDNNGNVGLQPGGATLTNTRLNVTAADNYDPSLYDGMGGIRIGTAASGVDGSYTGGIGFAIISGTSGIAGVQKGTDSDKQGLAFFTHPSTTGGDAAVEKMRLDADGNLGVGTQSPSGKLHVKDGNVNALVVTNTSCGNVGIKTTSPNASLVVKGNISYTYTNYTNVQNTFVNVISMAGYPSGLYQISIMKQTNASSYITAIIKWDSTAVGSSAGSIVNTIASNQVGISFNGSTTLQAISGLTTGTAMSANLKCLVKYEAACI